MNPSPDTDSATVLAEVDAALMPLSGLANLPLADQADRLEDVHRRLQDALATLDEA